MGGSADGGGEEAGVGGGVLEMGGVADGGGEEAGIGGGMNGTLTTGWAGLGIIAEANCAGDGEGKGGGRTMDTAGMLAPSKFSSCRRMNGSIRGSTGRGGSSAHSPRAYTLDSYSFDPSASITSSSSRGWHSVKNTQNDHSAARSAMKTLHPGVSEHCAAHAASSDSHVAWSGSCMDRSAPTSYGFSVQAPVSHASISHTVDGATRQ